MFVKLKSNLCARLSNTLRVTVAVLTYLGSLGSVTVSNFMTQGDKSGTPSVSVDAMLANVNF